MSSVCLYKWQVSLASLVMFHKKRDQSLLTVKMSTFTTSCFVSKR